MEKSALMVAVVLSDVSGSDVESLLSGVELLGEVEGLELGGMLLTELLEELLEELLLEFPQPAASTRISANAAQRNKIFFFMVDLPFPA